MSVYLCTLALLLISSFIQVFAKREIEKMLAGFIFIIGFIFSLYTNMFRNMIGGYDVFVYAFYFENINELGNYFNYEQGFYYFTKLIYLISEDRFFYFSVIAAIYTFSVFFISREISRKHYFFIFFLIFCKFYFYSFVYLRQVLAVVLVWLGCIYLSKDRKVVFIFLTLVASSFHISAIISIFFLFLNKSYSKGSLYFLFFLGFLFLFLPLEKILGFINIDKFGNYLSRDLNVFYFFESLVVFFLLVSYRKRIILIGREYNFYFNLAIFYSVFNLIVSSFSGFSRFSWYPFIGVVIFLGHQLMLGRNNINKLILFIGISFYFISMFLRIMLLRDGGDMMPYESIFSESIRNSQFQEIGK
ncbi:EpsG family protein [Mannheimia sp. E30BD]|uniref:EpsG family protein n=1 Tax=Mannheimia sp. E30BD TaxID=3278708 RepID=UPI00359D6975